MDKKDISRFSLPKGGVMYFKKSFYIAVFVIIVANCLSVIEKFRDGGLDGMEQKDILISLSAVIIAILGFWNFKLSEAMESLGEKFINNLSKINNEQVKIFAYLYKIENSNSGQAYEIPDDFVKNNRFHENLRALRAAQLIRGLKQARIRPGNQVGVRDFGKSIFDPAILPIITLTTRKPENIKWEDIFNEVHALGHLQWVKDLDKLASQPRSKGILCTNIIGGFNGKNHA